MDDLISRQAAIDALKICDNNEYGTNCHKCPIRDKRWNGAWENDETICYRKLMRGSAELLSAEPEISRIEQELHGKTPEEQYEFLYWLLLKFALAYTDSRLAVIEWLRGEQDG